MRHAHAAIAGGKAGIPDANFVVFIVPVRLPLSGFLQCDVMIKLCSPSCRALARRFLRDESGATAIEYGLIGALIAVVLITVLGNVGSALNTKFTLISTKLL